MKRPFIILQQLKTSGDWAQIEVLDDTQLNSTKDGLNYIKEYVTEKCLTAGNRFMVAQVGAEICVELQTKREVTFK